MSNTSTSYCRKATERDLHFFQSPGLWPCHPFLPLTRKAMTTGKTEYGVLYDARGDVALCGYLCTVYLTNLLFIPETEAEFLALPKHVYDTFDELADDGWTVD